MTPPFCNVRNLQYLPLPIGLYAGYCQQQKDGERHCRFLEEKGEKKDESFNYEELVDMKINALDLLERPKSYKVDKAAHKLIVKK